MLFGKLVLRDWHRCLHIFAFCARAPINLWYELHSFYTHSLRNKKNTKNYYTFYSLLANSNFSIRLVQIKPILIYTIHQSHLFNSIYSHRSIHFKFQLFCCYFIHRQSILNQSTSFIIIFYRPIDMIITIVFDWFCQLGTWIRQ